MKYIKTFVLASILVTLPLFTSEANAQIWAQCSNGSQIVRCETYDCPQGDTNSDGVCSLSDRSARLSDSRNDSFCANPLTGCGQVNYFGEGESDACSVRVKESGSNCNLYKASNAAFTPVPTKSPTPTPRPSATPRSGSTRSTATPTPSESPTASPKGTTKRTLPNTGPSEFALLGVIASGFAGLFLNNKFRK